MKDNISIKNRLVHLLLNAICSFGTRRNEIILESHPDFSCNTYELFRYMLSNNVLPGVKYVWILHDAATPHDDFGDNVDYIEMNPSSKIGKFKTYFRKYQARCVISCNSIFPKFTGPSDQLHFFLDHGSQLKDVRVNGKRIDVDCDYYFSQSKFFLPYHLQEYALTEDQIVCTGLPRYDQLHRKNNNIYRIVPDYAEFSKILIWVPTFRKHFQSSRVDCDREYPYGLPLLYSETDIEKLLHILKDTNTLLIIKPHPAQDVSSLATFNSLNIRILLNKNMQDGDIQINELLSQTDAMITDYSSIYYDYLELNRPIAITLDDIGEYTQQKGFVFDDVFSVIKGDYLYSIDDMCAFVKSISEEVDTKAEERKKVIDLIDDFFDGNSTERVWKFIFEQLNKQKKIYK